MERVNEDTPVAIAGVSFSILCIYEELDALQLGIWGSISSPEHNNIKYIDAPTNARYQHCIAGSYIQNLDHLL